MLTLFSKKFVDLLVHGSQKVFDEDDIEVYVYGVECFLNMVIVAGILCIWGIFTNSLFETFLWVAAFSLVRHYAGGLHAPSELCCIVSSIFIGATNYFVIQYAKLTIWAFLFCLLICLFFAPTDTSKLDLTQQQKRVFKIKSGLFIILGTAICFLIGENTFTLSIMYAFVCAASLCAISNLRKIEGCGGNR